MSDSITEAVERIMAEIPGFPRPAWRRTKKAVRDEVEKLWRERDELREQLAERDAALEWASQQMLCGELVALEQNDLGEMKLEWQLPGMDEPVIADDLLSLYRAAHEGEPSDDNMSPEKWKKLQDYLKTLPKDERADPDDVDLFI